VTSAQNGYPRQPQPHGWAFHLVIAVLVALAVAILIYLKVR